MSETLPKAGVIGIINMGSDMQACFDTVKLTEKYDYIHGAVGIHPECAADLPENWLSVVEELLGHDKIAAVGEIGLDYHWLEACPKDKQISAFKAQLELAHKTGYPVVVHDREAHGDMMDILREYRPKGVMHCFSGSAELALETVKLGMYIGLGGVVTFKNARHAVEAAKVVPLDRLLLETDAPYMSPVPLRGKRNDSSNIRYVAEKIAGIRSIPVDTLLNAVTENTKRLFNLD